MYNFAVAPYAGAWIEIILNVPVNIAGTVKVECGNGISYPRQIYISYTGREGYIRYFDGETWSSWKSMFGL